MGFRTITSVVAILAILIACSSGFTQGTPILKVKPKSLHFPTEVFGVTGTQSPTMAVHISNPKRGTPITGLAFGITGASASDFQQTSTTCASSLAAGANCVVKLAFTPGGVGVRSATFTISDDASAGAGAVNLNGKGIPGNLTVMPSGLNFGKVAPFASAQKSFSLVNHNKVALKIDSFSTSPPDDEYQASGCLGELAASGRCTVMVTFMPTSTGRKQTAMKIAGDQARSPSSIQLTGVGAGSPAATPTLTPTATSTPQAGTPTATATPTATPTVTIGKDALFVPDRNNDRIVAYPPPFSTGEDAVLAIGASDLVSFGSSNATQSTLVPWAITFDKDGNLWAIDGQNWRALEFVPPFSFGMNASVVLGEPDFTSAIGGVTAALMFGPEGIASDTSGDIFVSDSANSRILEFKPPFSNGMDASVVLGQADFTSNTLATTQSGLREPGAIAFDPSGNLWVADQDNSRVLEFVPPFVTGMDASLVLGQQNITSGSVDISQKALWMPFAVAADASGDIFVADTGSNRVVEFKPPFSNGMNASVVIGQTDFTSQGVGLTKSTMDAPVGLAFDSSGNLWVAENGNTRVMEFKPPFSNGMDAGLVIGQPDFTTATPALGPAMLNGPFGAAFVP